MPWYAWLNKQIQSVDGLDNLILISIILISIFMIIQNKKWLKLAWVVYMVSP